MFKRLLSLIIITTLTLGALSMSFAEEKAAQVKSEDKINSLLERKIITGYKDGTIRLEKPITRGEFSSVLAKIILEKDEDQTIDKFKSKLYFSDLERETTLNSYVNILFNKGIVSGYSDNTFRPGSEVTYNEVIAMIVRALDIEVERGKTWSEGYIKKANDLELLKNVSIDNYSNSAVRQKVFELIYNTLELNK